jgi:glycosyltransferase involved in cell wall biosynthesis
MTRYYKIGINATCIGNRPSGARQRISELYKFFFEKNSDFSLDLYVGLGSSLGASFGDIRNVRVIETPIPMEGRIRRIISGFGFWRKIRKEEKYDIFESLHLPPTIFPGCINCITVHDLRGCRFGSYFSRSLHKFFTWLCLRRADVTLTISRSMEDEIREIFPSLKTAVVYNATEFFGRREIHFGRKSSITTRKVRFCSIGHLEVRKNFTRLIEAISVLSKNGLDVELTIIGEDSGEADTLRKVVKGLQLESRVSFCSDISARELLVFLRESDAFVFPSLYEGFGIPLIEALAEGCACVVSDLPVFHEICGDYALYFNPLDSSDIAAKLSVSVSDMRTMGHINIDYTTLVGRFGFDAVAAGMRRNYLSLLDA